MLENLLFIGLGLLVGAFGTMIGVGGGFLLVPVLLWLYPNDPPETIAAISLAVVFFNAFSGSIAYARMKRIDYRSGLIFAASALPGTVLGALTTVLIPRHIFDVIIGGLLILAALFLFLKTNDYGNRRMSARAGGWSVHLMDSRGESYAFSFNIWRGVLLSLVVGYMSSILGIGGGIIHVPALVHLLNFPVHVATATSHFILAIMAFSGTLTHAVNGTLSGGFARVIPLSVGVIIGAQAGAHLSQRIHGRWIIRALATALVFVGLRTLWVLFK